MTDALAVLATALTASEQQPEQALTPAPERTELQAALRALLAAVHDQQPGAWVPVHAIVDYQRNRVLHRAIKNAVPGLVTAADVQQIVIHFGHTRRTLIRHPTDADTVDIAAVAKRANAALAEIGHVLRIYPARMTSNTCTPVQIEHQGLRFTAYLRRNPYVLHHEQIQQPL